MRYGAVFLSYASQILNQASMRSAAYPAQVEGLYQLGVNLKIGLTAPDAAASVAPMERPSWEYPE